MQSISDFKTSPVLFQHSKTVYFTNLERFTMLNWSLGGKRLVSVYSKSQPIAFAISRQRPPYLVHLSVHSKVIEVNDPFRRTDILSDIKVCHPTSWHERAQRDVLAQRSEPAANYFLVWPFSVYTANCRVTSWMNATLENVGSGLDFNCITVGRIFGACDCMCVLSDWVSTG